MLECLECYFPQFMARFGQYLEEVQPPLAIAEIRQLEIDLGIPLPESFKRLLSCTGGFQMYHPGPWLTFRSSAIHFELSPSCLFFGEYFKKADGDQVFFDVSEGLKNGEYPVVYYCHEDRPPTTWKLADSFAQWLEGLDG
jgi:hypothetical protein